jgi:hypothetical protein
LDAAANEVVNSRVASVVAKRIARMIAQELREHCTGPRNREVVIEWLLGNPLVSPHLPNYYMRPWMSKWKFYGKIYCPDVRFIRMSTRVHDYPADAFLPADGQMCPHGRDHASMRT